MQYLDAQIFLGCDLRHVPGAISGVRTVLFSSGESREPVSSVEIFRRSWEKRRKKQLLQRFHGMLMLLRWATTQVMLRHLGSKKQLGRTWLTGLNKFCEVFWAVQ